MIQSALSPLSLSEDEQGMAFGVVEKDWCPFGDLRANFCETTSGDCSCLPGTFLINHVFSWTRDLRIYVSLRPPTLRARLPYEVRDATVVSAARDDPTLAWYALTETGGSAVLVRCPSDDDGGGGSGVANCGIQLSIKMWCKIIFKGRLCLAETGVTATKICRINCHPAQNHWTKSVSGLQHPLPPPPPPLPPPPLRGHGCFSLEWRRPRPAVRGTPPLCLINKSCPLSRSSALSAAPLFRPPLFLR